MITIKILSGGQEVAKAEWISYAAERKMAPIYTLGNEWYEKNYLHAKPRYYGSLSTNDPINENAIHTIIIEEEQDGKLEQTILEMVEFFYQEEGARHFVALDLESRNKITWYSRAREEIGHTGKLIKTE